MSSPDVRMGEGDTLPEVTETVMVDGEPYDLTGFTAVLKRASPAGAVSTRPVTIDPDQTANPGKITYTRFGAAEATPGDWLMRVKLTRTSDSAKLSWDADRSTLVEVTPDPGSA